MPTAPDPSRFPLTEEVRALGAAISNGGGRPILVGGWVRDCLLSHPHSKDFDIEVFGMAPDKLRGILGKFGSVHAVGRHFGVLKLSTQGQEFDVSVPRRESKTGKGHKGFWVEPDPTMTFEQAASRRDFTINAMGYDFLAREFLNPFRGWEDLEAKRLRHVGPAFGEDPLRVLRAMQFAGRFGLTILVETQAICREQDLRELPRERIWEEVKKLMLRAPSPAHGWNYAEDLGVLKIFPELAALKALPPSSDDRRTPWVRTLATVDAVAALGDLSPMERLHLCMAALCHELGRTVAGRTDAPFDGDLARAAVEPTQSLVARLTNEVDMTKAVVPLVRELPAIQALWLRRETGCEPEVRRLALRVPLESLLHLAQARHAAMSSTQGESPTVTWLRGTAARLNVLAGPPEPLLKGRHLLELGYRQGPEMGELLHRAFERQLEGEFATMEDAMQWLKRNAPASLAPEGARP